jgi:hypothetical protein
MASLNWGRGFFRLWLAVSAIWIAVVGYSLRGELSMLREPLLWQTTSEVHSYPLKPAAIGETSTLSDDDVQSMLLQRQAQVRDLLRAETLTGVALVLLPPFFLLLIGMLVGWIGRGFFQRA